jgi:hypothetical protein
METEFATDFVMVYRAIATLCIGQRGNIGFEPKLTKTNFKSCLHYSGGIGNVRNYVGGN